MELTHPGRFVAASLGAPHRRGRAVSLVMLGLPVANVVGVPEASRRDRDQRRAHDDADGYAEITWPAAGIETWTPRAISTADP